MKHPDAFERMVDNVSRGWDEQDRYEILKLLRRYHARVRRRVGKLCKYEREAQRCTIYEKGYLDACGDILAALDAMKRGKA